MKLALVSLNQSWENKTENQSRIIQILDQIKETSTDLVIFPEMTLTGFTMNTPGCSEAFETSETIRFFKDCSIRYSLNIVFGVILKNGKKSTNNLILTTPEGIGVNYSKIHPFSYSGEDKFYQAGQIPGKGVINNVNFGFTICYDLRFPEIFQALSKTCTVIINIANWPESRIDHWLTLLKARAIENQCVMIGVNRTGKDGNEISYTKSSKIYSAMGIELSPNVISVQLDFYELELSEVEITRALYPFKKDRNTPLYKKVL